MSRGFLLENDLNLSHQNVDGLLNLYELNFYFFLKVLEKHPEKIPNIFFNMFSAPSNTVIKFLSNKSNIIQDLSIISKMPKITFIKSIF